MPALQKFHANVARHVKSMDKNICANVIRHESIVTTRAKAKRVQPKLERFLTKTLRENESLENKLDNKHLRFLQPPDVKTLGNKIVDELSDRYQGRNAGYTRLIRLEPRLGEDKAPMAVLELVDSNFDIKFWYTAKIVARLQLQNLPLDKLTKYEVSKLIKFRKNGQEKFDEAVETAKKEFFKYNAETGEIEDEAIKQNLKNKPRDHGINFQKSKKFHTKERFDKQSVELPQSPFLA
ncbi:hypothetical protein CLIB1444_05S03378 [[Candida] jaroonii]|uniref:Uncharacterized protein n=1 Tax=[Candida] jaroonii TaxID=467808 RepID=A0ACA9Y8Q3_9ASCO|nr:hypothetical protein CLIB1444_05S03378 [[Candida] jaroonii]